MAKSDTTHKNFEKYCASLKARGYENLPSSKYSLTDPLLLDKLGKEGMKLLEVEGGSAPQVPEKTLETALGEKSQNCYVRARCKVLGDMQPSRRERILNMEKNHTTEHSFDYKEFVKRVRQLGDDYSNKKNLDK